MYNHVGLLISIEGVVRASYDIVSSLIQLGL